ncbi:MAG: LacI family transcriptional regulator [Deltaproteobacteria bacterium]|nr:MAG: LacI family transcriptional regulator [Deltaproteobacteria bacterium]
MEESFQEYLYEIVHEWSRTLHVLGFTLVPAFFILDYFMIPQELLKRFAIYRLVATVFVVINFVILRTMRPRRSSVLFAYMFSFVVGGAIALMTTDLEGFNSRYYAGLNLVLMGVNLLMPWRASNATLNSSIVIALYLILNLLFPKPYNPRILLNNLFFMLSTAIISVSIAHLRFQLIFKEFSTRFDLKAARDALWSEMEVAKQIQTSLLPRKHRVKGYEVAATMVPADEVGGDYYDIIETKAGEAWLSIGDVSGHGVESGLIMMMTQTGIFTTVNHSSGHKPSEVLERVNAVLKENISRLGTDRYMTITVVMLENDRIFFSGKHQDILVYRASSSSVEVVPTSGTWLGVVDELNGFVDDRSLEVDTGDLVLFYTDGVTEAMNEQGEMFGEQRLKEALNRYADLPVDEIVSNIVRDLQEFMKEQHDDITLMVLKRSSGN